MAAPIKRLKRPPPPAYDLSKVPGATPGAMKMGLIEAIAEKHGVTRDDIISHGRKPAMVKARGEAMLLVYCGWPMTYTEVGRLFDRDHTSVIHLIARTLGWDYRDNGMSMWIVRTLTPKRIAELHREAHRTAVEGFIRAQLRQVAQERVENAIATALKALEG